MIELDTILSKLHYVGNAMSSITDGRNLQEMSSLDSSYNYSNSYGIVIESDLQSEYSLIPELALNNNTNNHTHNGTNPDNGIKPVKDINVKGVLASTILNIFLFIFLSLAYEFLRRKLPNIYANKFQRAEARRRLLENETDTTNPVPLSWLGPVFGISWSKILEDGGLDAYMYLRYLRMLFVLTAVSAIWALIILWPIYGTGSNNTKGFYIFTMVNISNDDNWRFWFSTVFMYLFTLYFFFLLQREIKNFVSLRLEFLGRGQKGVHPQHHYSLVVEGIPKELRSDNALYQYFDRLYPGKVHSARVVIGLSDLNKLSAKRLKITRKLEKAIAKYEATGERPINIVGRKRCMCCNVECGSCNVQCGKTEMIDVDEYEDDVKIQKGVKVDSVQYYTRELRIVNEKFLEMQKKRNEEAEDGNVSILADNWFTTVFDATSNAKSNVDEFLRFNRKNTETESTGTDPPNDTSLDDNQGVASTSQPPLNNNIDNPDTDEKAVPLLQNDQLNNNSEAAKTPVPDEELQETGFFGTSKRLAGLDFFYSTYKETSDIVNTYAESQYMESSMSSTGFVTFHDLVSVTSAANAPLTHKPDMLKCQVAPEKRDVYWSNAHISIEQQNGRISFANAAVAAGAIVWSIPVALIQALANIDNLAKIPGFKWIKNVFTGDIKILLNNYLPVVSLLGIMLLLPMIFESIAINFERRKSLSDIHRSVVKRYFYYQLANVYISITAASIWSSLGTILNHPGSIFDILGRSLPRVVGYFTSLLITKTLAGLPLVILRIGSVFRFLTLRLSLRPENLTQRELDEVYRQERFYYGWDYPNQLVVIVIVFAYVCIAPMILLLGAIYFAVALIVYKKQILFVYVPEYESGGALFPIACTRTVVGLFLGQLTFLGYMIIRKCYGQVILGLPLLIITPWWMNTLHNDHFKNAVALTMERASEADTFHEKSHDSTLPSIDENEELTESGKPQESFEKAHYRQPILTEEARTLLPYRRGQQDELTTIALMKLGFIDEEDVEEVAEEAVEEASSPTQAPVPDNKTEASSPTQAPVPDNKTEAKEENKDSSA